MLTDLRFEHYSLKEFVLPVSTATCNAWFCEIHNLKDVLSVFTCVAHSKVEPLLVTPRVCIDLHVQAVLARGDSVGPKQVATLENSVNEKDISVVFSHQPGHRLLQLLHIPR